jgi:inhibitor of KinA sporulation pathway (predicted exonuclease)
MKIVILDLEWNTAYYRKEQRFLNEIIEFGAVKLNERMKVVDEFQMFVKSRVSKKLRGMVKELTHISNEQLQEDGKDFETVMKAFTKWAGKNTLILTWSNTDLYTLMDNCRAFLGDRAIPFLHQYADLQKYVQHQIRWQGGNQLGLSKAAEEMNVSADGIDLHRAKGDSLLSARVLAKCYDKTAMKGYIQNADAPDFYDRFLFKPYAVTDINSPHIQPEDLVFACADCESNMKRVRGWKRCNKALESIYVCKNCNKAFIAKLQVQKLYDSVSVKRTLVQTQLPKKSSSSPHRKRRGGKSKKPAETVGV